MVEGHTQLRTRPRHTTIRDSCGKSSIGYEHKNVLFLAHVCADNGRKPNGASLVRRRYDNFGTVIIFSTIPADRPKNLYRTFSLFFILFFTL
jgi:hypothetical protein